MKTTTIYESEDSVIRVLPHEVEESFTTLSGTNNGKPLKIPKPGDLAYITIYAGKERFIHVNESYIPVLKDILSELEIIYKLNKDSE